VMKAGTYLTVVACLGPTGPGFAKCLVEMARLLGKKICACTSSTCGGEPCRQYAICKPPGKWCCADPK
jgi:hypothetical protein